MRSNSRQASSSSAGATYLRNDETIERLRAVVRDAARREDSILRVILFGSLARGRATPKSDADLVVVLREGAPRRMDRIPPLLDLFRDSPLPLDLHPYTQSEWAEACERGEAIPRLAAREGVELLDATSPGTSGSHSAERGLSTIEGIMLIVLLIVAAGVVVTLVPLLGHESPMKTDCMNNVKQLVGLLEVSAGATYPAYRGPDLLLYLVTKGDLVGEDSLELLFCPGDERESLAKAGGAAAYHDLDLSKPGGRGHLTSYAGRDQLDPACAAERRSLPPKVLLCDDSDDHHDGRGFVVGLTGGAVRWRHKVDDYGLDEGTAVTVGAGSIVEELRCLRTD